MSDGEDVKPDTRLVQGGRRKAWTSGIVNPPVWRASTILFDDVEAMREAGIGRVGTLHYGRSGTPTQWALAEALTELEPGAAGTRLFPSGVAAISIALMAVLRPGDELLMVDSAYAPTRAFCDGVLARQGVTTRYYDPLIGANIADLIGDKTRAIFLESPGSLTFEVQDVPAICAVARERGVATLLDNTWATPLLFPAIAAGVDLTILSCTKYIVGHSDVMLGSVTANEGHWKALEQTSRAFGQHVSPDDAWLATRGLRTMGVRLRQHEASGLKVARWLAEQPQVARVLHPALPGCPGHDHWTRDFRGASGLFSFVLNGGDEAARARLIDGLQHFGIGYSWGGFESLALPVDPAKLRTATSHEQEGPMVRLHIGLEDVDDLIADLARGLAGYGTAA
ncbi:cystathionine beta-lyase [Sphingosinicella humi]|uniref:Cystathionine beta-lyase n=1 Tax=Allosphingosinicella humi TaxID=2068657 RepID=A0A2U2J0M5_9SPHN|nr:cystathionine beta-lyase [Sphingosinicella humi]PWG01885.1 cystathionine beta-lyase [Sphingosinicella humi]